MVQIWLPKSNYRYSRWAYSMPNVFIVFNQKTGEHKLLVFNGIYLKVKKDLLDCFGENKYLI